MAGFKSLGTVVSYPIGSSNQQEITEILDDKGATAYEIGTDGKLSMFGHLSSTTMGTQDERQVYISTPVTDDGGNGSAYMPDYEAKGVRIITQGNVTDRSGVNMLAKNQASVETDTAGFTATGGSAISRDTTEKYDGTASLKIVTTTSILSGVDLVEVPAVAGIHYSFRCMLKGDGNMMFRIYAYNSSNVDIGVTQGTMATTNTWQEFKLENYIAPIGTTKLIVKLGTPQPNVRTVYIDAIQLEANSVSTAFAMPGDAPLSTGNYITEWTGRKYSYNVVPSVNYVLSRLYYKLGSNLVMDSNSVINVRGYKGTNEAGIKILDRTISAGTAPYVIVPGGEVYIDVPNLDYREGEEFHYVLEMLDSDLSHQFSIVTNEDNAQPWRAVDGQRFEMKAMIPSNALYPDLIVTSPIANATGVSLTPTITTTRGISKTMHWHGIPNAVATGASAFPVVATINLPAGALGSRGVIRGSMFIGVTTPSGTPMAFIDFGGASAVVDLGMNGTSHVEFEIAVTGVNNQRTYMNSGYDRMVVMNSANLSLTQNLEIRINAGADGHTATLYNYDVQLVNSEVEQPGEYQVDSTEVKIKEASTQTTAFQSSTSGLSGTVTSEKKLKGSTSYNAYARHKTSSGIVLPWSSVVNFKTLMDLTMTLNTGITSGDLVELNVGESATASAYDFHVSGLSDKFPPTAFDSGEFRFRDSTGVDLLFNVHSLVGTTPNRTAKCYIKTNTQVISDSKIKLLGVGASATNVSQLATWESNTFFPAMSTTVGSATENFGGFTLRQVIKSGDITGSGLNQFKLKLRRGLLGSATIDSMYLGVGATTGDEYDFAGTPVQVRVGDATSFTMTDNTVYTTDAVALNVPNGSNLVLSVYISAGTLGQAARTTNLIGYYKSGNDAATIDATTYVDSNLKYLVESIDAGHFDAWTPANLTGTYSWLDTADISQALSAAVPSWTSKGTAVTFAEANVANQPYVKSTLVNGNKMLNFGGVDDSLTVTMNHLASTSHGIYVVWEPKSLTEYHDIFGYWESNTGSVLLMDLASSNMGNVAAHVFDRADTITSPALSKPSIIGQRFNRTDLDVWASHNGVLSAKKDVQTLYTGGGTKTYGLGGKTRPSASEYANGYVGDVIIATYDMGDPSQNTDAGKLTGYLAHKYATIADLALGHPYKVAPPALTAKLIHTDKFLSVS